MATRYARLFDPTTQFQTKSGALNTAGLLRVYLAETDDLAEVFDDGNSLISQPVVLDNNGRAPGLFVDSTKTYRLEVYDRYGSLMFTIRSMTSTGGGGGSSTGNYYPGDVFIDIDQEMREISLKNLKRLRGDGNTIIETDYEDEVVFSVNPEIIGDSTKVKAGPNISVEYDSDGNEYTVSGNYNGSETIDIDSDGEISGKYRGGYGIEVSGNKIQTTHHQLVWTNSTSYGYCKVFEFTWDKVYGRGLCVFTATHYGGDYATFAVSLTRALGADYTVAWPYVVSASPGILDDGFIDRLEIRADGDRIIGYLKLRGFTQSQFWLDWEGSSEAGAVSFEPQLTDSPKGSIAWAKAVTKDDVSYSQTDTDLLFQKKLIAGDNIIIDSDNVISAPADYDGRVFIATYGTTTFADIKSAISNGEYVVVKGAGGAVYYTLSNNLSARIVFIGKTSPVVGSDSFVEVDSDNNWTQREASLPKTSFTAHGSVTTTDNYNDVGNTASFAIGQKGTHGGLLDIGAKTGSSGWVGSYKSLIRIYHTSASESAPTSGSTAFGTVTLGTEYVSLCSVSQYLLAGNVQWTYIIELAYSASPGRGLRLTVSGIGSSDITWMAEELR